MTTRDERLRSLVEAIYPEADPFADQNIWRIGRAVMEWLENRSDEVLTKRVFLDDDGDRWFEISPGQFICAPTFEDAQRLASEGSWTEDAIRDIVNVTEITK